MATRENFVVVFRAQGAQALTRAVGSIQNAMSRLGAVMTKVMKVMAGIGVVGITAFGAAMVSAQRRLQEMTQATETLGLKSVENFQALGEAAQLAGVNIDQVKEAMAEMQRRLVDPANPANEVLAGLGFAGSKREQLNRATPEQQFSRITEAIKKLGKDPAMQQFAADEIFGGAGQEILPFLRRGALDMINQIGSENRRLGLNFTEQDQAASEQMRETLARIGQIMQDLMTKISSNPAMLEAMVSFKDALTDMIEAMGGGEQIARSFADALKGAVSTMRSVSGELAKLFDFEGVTRGRAGVDRVYGRVAP